MNKLDYLKTEGRFDGVAFKPEGGWFFQTPSGKWGLHVGLRVTDDVSEEGKCITWTGWLSDKAMPFTIKTLREAFGFNGDLNALQDGKVTFADMPCSFTTANEDYNGKTNLKVKWLNPINKQSSTPALASDEVKAFIATINAKAKAMAADSGEVDDIWV
jgi:hypothetical protein